MVGLACGSRGSSRACRACRRYGRGRGRRSSAHSAPQAATTAPASARHCRRRRRSSACRAPGRRARPVEHGAGVAHREGQRDRLVACPCRGRRPPWRRPRPAPSVTAPVVRPSTMKRDLLGASSAAAVALLADDFLRQAAHAHPTRPALRPGRRSERARSDRASFAPPIGATPWSPRARARRRSCRRRSW